MKRQLKTKDPIKVRMKKLSNGYQSIYLDIYTNGKRKYEFLKLYLIPETEKEDKLRNDETLKLANAIKSQKIVELQNETYNFNRTGFPHIKLINYIEKIVQSGSTNRAKKDILQAIIHHLKRYDPQGILLEKIDKSYILGFIEYLKKAKQQHHKAEKGLHTNTQLYYFKMLRYCLNHAVSEEYISENPINKIKNEEKPKNHKREREYLTISELKRLVRTPFYNKLLKQAFLFSCFCGLRHCDIAALKWKNIHYDDAHNASLSIVQQKTQEAISLPLSHEAVKYLPERDMAQDDDTVFAGLISLSRSNIILDKWAKQADIQKHITFHVARHTHATMLLTLGADLYTVSKLLGHTNIQTTQIYAKIVDESKVKAIALIPDIS
ncbi:site-specific integrase [Bacteroides helcogenes]|uniref:Integrase family protein n=1 Tax=Bacteroides helcogenes (strain ATCC 35417 / DSM 20613 / JCM 6297 / CCUG 15421 / P 36-108) TaxID=693979 RepID=E6SNP7_BACT6|nr:site-specific integrase [Bacteroides helcogenes]ADV44780.1 integrase family protein [Bacteroides helcogenes P 36-108]MDY5239990.1 site-specific integrase [Bacteroides helcogenes]